MNVQSEETNFLFNLNTLYEPTPAFIINKITIDPTFVTNNPIHQETIDQFSHKLCLYILKSELANDTDKIKCSLDTTIAIPTGSFKDFVENLLINFLFIFKEVYLMKHLLQNIMYQLEDFLFFDINLNCTLLKFFIKENINNFCKKCNIATKSKKFININDCILKIN